MTLIRYGLLIIAALCSIKVVFASAGVGLSIYELAKELEPSEATRANAYQIIIGYSAAVSVVGCTSLVLAISEMRKRPKFRFMPHFAGAAFVVFSLHVIYVYLPLPSKLENSVLSEFAASLMWLPFAMLAGAMIPMFFRLYHRSDNVNGNSTAGH